MAGGGLGGPAAGRAAVLVEREVDVDLVRVLALLAHRVRAHDGAYVVGERPPGREYGAAVTRVDGHDGGVLAGARQEQREGLVAASGGEVA